MKSILIIDDCEIVTGHITGSLEATGAYCCDAVPTLDHLDALPRHGSAHDIVILDPSASGGYSAEHIRDRLLRRIGDHDTVAFLPATSRTFAMRCLKAGFSAAIARNAGMDGIAVALDCVEFGRLFVDGAFGSVAEASNAPPLEGSACLSPWERDVLLGIARGGAHKEIALSLDLSPSSVETYKAPGMNKLVLESRTDVVQHALAHR